MLNLELVFGISNEHNSQWLDYDWVNHGCVYILNYDLLNHCLSSHDILNP